MATRSDEEPVEPLSSAPTSPLPAATPPNPSSTVPPPALTRTRKLPRPPRSARGLGALGPVLGGFVDSPERQREFEARLRDASEPPRLGRYDILGIIGRGSVTTVLRALDPEDGHEIAIRVIHSDIDGRHGRRMLREARAMAELSHPNLMQTLHVDTVARHIFLVMELVRGKNLRKWMGSTPRPTWADCVQVYIQAGEGLAAMHAAGLVHRDFKPSSAIVDKDGRVRVIDFRLVLVPDDSPLIAPDNDDPVDGTANPGAVLGTPAYMPLAQLRGRPADPYSDQFSFCVSLYESLYGHRPFEGETVAALMRSMGSEHVRPAPGRTRVPSELREVVLRGLALEPHKRWNSMPDLLASLREVLRNKANPPRWRAWWR
ncbi:MAG: serine/threonine-protein kinase [Myxococcota bacterium]